MNQNIANSKIHCRGRIGFYKLTHTMKRLHHSTYYVPLHNARKLLFLIAIFSSNSGQNPNSKLAFFTPKPLSRLFSSQKVKAESVFLLVHMEGENSHNDPLQLMSLNCGWSIANDVCHAPEDDLNQKMIMEAGRSVNQTDALALPWMIQSPMPAQSSVDFLAESSTFLPKSPYEDMLERISSVGGIHAAGGISEFQRDVLYCSSLGKACGSKSTDLSLDMDPWKHHTSWTDTFSGDSFDNVSLVDQKVTVDAPSFPSRPHKSASKQKAQATDRARRVRIAERMTALEELLPQSVEGGQEFVLDDVIDHIKFLQLQIKDLSKSRLGGGTITEPMIFREGYGHYFLHQQMLSEPLEEMIGKLLETNPVAANQLLKDKGLSMVPLGLTKKLF